MWWCTIFKRPHQEAEFILCFFLTHAKSGKHFLLQFPPENAYGSTTYLRAIEHHIVSICFYVAILAKVIHPFYMFRLRRRKGMVACHPPVSRFVIFKQREVYYP